VRLALAFLTLVSLVLFVGIASFRINKDLGTRVASLRSSHLIDLRRVDLSRVGLEFEGLWNPRVGFIATDIVVMPKAARPLMRGAIQAIDLEQRTLTLYGHVLYLTEKSESGDQKDEPISLQELRVGQRVEAICTIDAGRWEVSKVYQEKVKASDKVKGSASSWDLDGRAPDSVDIHGFRVLVDPATSSGSESALGHIEKATQIIKLLHESRGTALDLVGRTRVGGGDVEPDGEEDAGIEEGPPGEHLSALVSQLASLVEEAQGRNLAGEAVPGLEYLRVLEPLARSVPTLRDEAATLRELAPQEPRVAQQRVEQVFMPLVQETLLPAAYGYLSEAEDDLGDQLRSVLAKTDSTTRIALMTSVVAVVVALVLGFLVWRSIHRPMRVLHDAALRLGQGHLDTRIQLDSHDEIGVLAKAFNKMAGELANTTVSMESLESVFDSMAAALIVFDPDGNIVNVNRATLTLVGRERSELIGQTFDLVCRFSAGQSARPGPGVREPSGLPAMRIEPVEKVFVRKDGSEFPVSFSGAELRSGGGPLQGYVCVALDLTEQKRIQQQLRESLDEKELLLREVHHRVKNNMQVISSLLAMQSSAGDPEVQKKLDESQNRIRSIALIHEQLYRSSELSHIDVQSYFETLTSQLLQSFGKSGAVRLELATDPIALDIDQSMACGLIVNELVTNALKYAYPAEKGGVIRVSLREHPSGERVLTVSDDGPGLNGAKRSGPPSLGMSLVTTLARQLRGRVEVDGSCGTLVRVFFGAKSSTAVSA
jgi:PAS domain S-box-containing protein